MPPCRRPQPDYPRRATRWFFNPATVARILAMLGLSVVSTGPAAFSRDLAPAGEPVDESTQYAVETLVTGLNSPCGLAVRPGTPESGPYLLLFCESGAGRVSQFQSDDPATRKDVVTGFPVDSGRPLALLFLSPNRLAVAVSRVDDAGMIRVYALPDDHSPLSHDAPDHAVRPSKAPAAASISLVDLDRVSLTASEDALYASVSRPKSHGQLLKAIVDANRLADLQAFITHNQQGESSHPSAVTVNPKPRFHYLVVARNVDDSQNSRVSMYAPSSGEMALDLATNLRNIVALAYSPSGDLYAIDAPVDEPQQGGVYRLEAIQVDGQESCRPVKIASIERPSSLAFTPDAALYVTGLGASGDAARSSAGVLLKISPKPNNPKL